jgi:Fe(3+) dicitrate transport protein
MNELLPGIGMILGSEDNHAFAGLHVGFAPPRVATAITADGINEQLDAERSLAYEVGARLSPTGWARVEVTGFLSSYVNQVIPSAGANRQDTLQNAGQTRHAGVESSVSFGVGEALDLGVALDAGVRYTFSHASFAAGQFEGNLLPYAPLHTGSATLDVEHPIGVGGQVAVIYVGEQFTDEENTLLEDAGGRVGLMDARAILDVAARYRHAGTGLTATVSVKNVLDRPYVSTRRPDGIFPAGFRQVTFGLQWDYEEPEEPATAAF